ncbi:MAG: radical SAM protein [Chloroflexi bacterium]|nr:radical SAM protein [Chloroflexota bacterium]
MAVLDAQAFALLEQFSLPTTLDEILLRSSQWSPVAIERGTALLYEAGFLQDISRAGFIDSTQQPQTLSAWLHVTNACNLRCHYCYLHKSSERMTEDTSRQAIEAIFRSAVKHHFGHVRLTYAGGEASLHPVSIFAIHDYASRLAEQHGMTFSAYMLSNGVFLAKQTIQEIKERSIGIGISLDGIGEDHDKQRPFISGKGSFKYVDRTITQLLEHGLVPHINVTVSQCNLDGLPRLIEYILEREMSFSLSYYRDNEYSSDIDDLQFTDASMIAGMREAFAVIKRRLPRQRLLGSLIDKASMDTSHSYTCGVGQNYLVIDQHGGVAKCQADIKRTVTTIDADDPLDYIRSDRSGVQGIAVEDKAGCRDCQWRHWCTGGCPQLTYRLTGRSDVKSPNCNIYKALFPDVLDLEALRLLTYESPIML